MSDVRFFHVAFAHWPVFALLAGFAVVMVVVAQVRRDAGSGVRVGTLPTLADRGLVLPAIYLRAAREANGLLP